MTYSPVLPITVFYDHTCPMCRSEMLGLKAKHNGNAIILVDCSPTDFDETPFVKDGIHRIDMMKLIHAKDANGKWLIGVDVFAVVYRLAGLRFLSAVWGSRLLRPILSRLYPWVANNRMWLSKFGVPKLFSAMEKPCGADGGVCSIESSSRGKH
jgi:predicted DCC family thiol-disulfide oxidoreductase YuxK